MNATLVAVLVLAAGTYVFRLAGPLLHGRVELPARVQELLTVGATVLLVGLLATGALTEGTASPGGRGPPECWPAGCSRGVRRPSPSSSWAPPRRRASCGSRACRRGHAGAAIRSGSGG